MAREHILATERETLKFRLLAITAVGALLYLRQDTVVLGPALGLTVAYLAYALLLHIWIIPRWPSPYLVYAMILVDSAAVLGALRFTGGMTSPIFILFPLVIIYYATYLGYTSSILTATVVSLSYVAALLLEGSNAESPATIVAVQVPFFYLLATFAGYLASKRLQVQAEKEELQELIRLESGAKGLLEVARNISRTLRPDLVLQEIASTAPRLIGLSHSLVALLEEGETLRGAAANLTPAALGVRNIQEIETPLSQDLSAADALRTRWPVAVARGRKEKSALPRWLKEETIGALLVLPLLADSQRLGVVYLFDAAPHHPFTEAEMVVALSYAEVASLAIANAQRHEEAERRISRLVSELESTIQRLERMREARQKSVIQVGGLRIDGLRGQALYNNKAINLTPIEFELLYALAEKPGRPNNQKTLLRRVWGDDYRGKANVVDVCIHRLRRKVEPNPSSPQLILTVRGEGYMLSGNIPEPPTA